MDWLRYSNQGAVRNNPLSDQLVQAMSFLPEMGLEMDVFSGGQENNTTHGLGSTRHNDGMAADVFFKRNGEPLSWENPEDIPVLQEIVRRAKVNGLTGFGAGEGYMRPGSMHIGYGNEAVWGRDGRSANAPEWLVEAYNSPQVPEPVNRLAEAPPQQQAPEQVARAHPGIFQLPFNRLTMDEPRAQTHSNSLAIF